MSDYLANPNEKTASSACDHLAKCMQLKDFEKAHLAVFMAPTAENINKLALAMAKEYHFPIKGAQSLESYLKDPKNELKKSEFTKIVSEELGPHTGQQIEALTVMIATSVAGKVGAAALGEAGVAGEAAVASSSVNVAGVESSAGHAAGELASLTPKTAAAESLTVAQMEERLARLPSHTNYETQLKVPDRTTQIHVQNLEGSIPLEIDQAAKQATEILSEHKTVGQWLKEMASGQHSTLLPDGDHPHTSNLLNAYAEHLKHIPLRCRFSGIGAGGESLTFSPSLQIKHLQIHPETKLASLKPGANFQAADKHKSWDMINNKAIAKNPLHTDEKLHDSVLKITKPALREEFGSMDHLSGTRDWEGTRTSPLWSKTIDVSGSKKSIKSYIYFQEKLTPTRPSQEQLDAIREAISKSNRVIWDKDSIDGGQFGKNKSGQLKLMDLTATIDENSEYWNQFHK